MSSLMIWTPEDGHYYGNTQLNWDHSWLHAAGRDIPTILKKARLPVGKPFQLSAPSLMERYLLETVAELKAWGKPDATILRNQFENMVRMLARSLFDQPKQLAPAHLLELKSYIEEHFTEGLNLPALARRAGWSVPHLCTEFKRFFGISIIQYVQQLRLNQAAYLLRDHNWRVSEIASQVGYADLYTFSKMFKRSLGISPRGFRQRNIP
jgi:iron complex transport system substrate-binding protein